MTVRTRILSIHLMQKLKNNTSMAKNLGIEYRISKIASSKKFTEIQKEKDQNV